MANAWRWTNELIAFLLELAALGALCYWGVRIGRGAPTKVVLGVGAPLLAAVVWGLFAAPRARFRVPLLAVIAVKALVFAAATAAWYAVGQRGVAAGYALLAAVNTTVVTMARRSDRAA